MPTVALIGANRGIGLELARLSAARGDHVIATCRAASPELRALKVNLIEGIDVQDDAVVPVLREALDGVPIDVLVCNAGILEVDPLDHLSFDALRRQWEVNALGPLRVVSALRGNLAAGSRLALVTSRMGSIADNTSGGMYGYRMSKAALNMAGKSLSIDLAPQGVAVALLHPGFVQTDMTGGRGDATPAEAAARLWARIDALSLEESGRFWHANGQALPW